MTDYESLKVTELKALLKEREVPAQGLTRKAQFIQALQDDDLKTQAATSAEAAEGDTRDARPVEDAAQADSQKEGAAVEPEPVNGAADETVTTPATQEEVAEQEEKAPVVKEPKEEPVVEAPKTVEESPAPAPVNTDSEERKRKRDEPTGEEDTTAATKRTKTEDIGTEDPMHALEAKDAPADVQMEDAYPAQEPIETATNDTASIPSEHVPTTALYIRNLMRPLQAPAFRSDLLALADPSGMEQDSAITDLHLDVLKTHALVVCSSVQTAARLRAALHDRPWPQHESQRKALWVDYVPETKVAGWIDDEQRAGRDARFEIVYSGSEIGRKTAELSEINARPAPPREAPPPREPATTGQGMPGAPQGPRGQRVQRQPVPEPAPKQQSTSFNKLDQYFRFTTAKPKIYFQPVDKQLADKRLGELDHETSRDWRGGQSWNRGTKLAPIDQLRRYTFDDGDRVVDGGMDFGGFGRRQGAGGSGAFNPNAPRGGGGGGGGRGGRGGYR